MSNNKKPTNDLEQKIAALNITNNAHVQVKALENIQGGMAHYIILIIGNQQPIIIKSGENNYKKITQQLTMI